jgi:hypothetical protein
MQWIFDHLQIVALVLIGIVSVFKSLLEAKAKKQEEDQEQPYPEEYYEPEEEIYQQQPQPSVPPPLPWGGVSVPPPLREAGYEAAVANEAAKALKHQQDLAERLQQIRETKATTTGGAAATRARIANKGSKKTSSQVPLSLRARLKNPAEVRRAFVMREILDPPVSLR